MAIFIGDTPAQKIQQTGEAINKIQQDYEAEKLRREEYTDQFDASQEDYSMLFGEFKEVLGKMVDGIVKAQVNVEETNSKEARDLLKEKSKQYQNLLAIAKAHTQVGMKAFSDAYNGLYYETPDQLKEQVHNNLKTALDGFDLNNIYESKIFDPDFVLFNAVPYDKALEATNPEFYGEGILRSMERFKYDFYNITKDGSFYFDEGKFNEKFDAIAENLLLNNARAMQAAAYTYSFLHEELLKDKSLAELRDDVLEDKDVVDKDGNVTKKGMSTQAAEEYKETLRNYVASRLSQRITPRKAQGELNQLPYMVMTGTINVGGRAFSGRNKVYRLSGDLVAVETGATRGERGQLQFFKVKEKEVNKTSSLDGLLFDPGKEITSKEVFPQSNNWEQIRAEDIFDIVSKTDKTLFESLIATFPEVKQPQTSTGNTKGGFVPYDVWEKSNPGGSFSDWEKLREEWEQKNK